MSEDEATRAAALAVGTDPTSPRSRLDREARTAATFGAVFGFLGVAAGAFGAHALSGRLDAGALATFDTAVRYQLVHALALLAHAALFRGRLGVAGRWSWRLFVAGTIVFSGSLYLLVATGETWWGAATPIGGLAFLSGWVLLMVEAVAPPRRPA